MGNNRYWNSILGQLDHVGISSKRRNTLFGKILFWYRDWSFMCRRSNVHLWNRWDFSAWCTRCFLPAFLDRRYFVWLPGGGNRRLEDIHLVLLDFPNPSDGHSFLHSWLADFPRQTGNDLFADHSTLLTCFLFCLPTVDENLITLSTFFFLFKQGSRQEAGAALKWFWGRQCDTQMALQNIQSDLDALSGDAKFSDLFTVRANLMAFIISLALMLFQQFSGINAVIFYAQSIFEAAGSTLDPALCTIIVGVVQVVMTVTSALLIEKAGRRILLLQSSVMMGLCLIMLGVYFSMKEGGSDVTNISVIPLASVVIFIICFSLGFGPIPWMMVSKNRRRTIWRVSQLH